MNIATSRWHPTGAVRRLIAICMLLLCIPVQAQLNCPTQTIHIGNGPARTMETWSGGGESLLFVGEGAMLTIYNIANPTAPVKLGEIGLSGPVWHIDIRDDGALAVVSDRRSQIRIVNISNRSAPTLLGSYTVPGRLPHGVAVQGNRVYAAVTPAGLAVLDISNPANPTELAQVVTPGTDFVFDVEVSGNFAYLADDAEGVTVWNISNPASPVAASSFAAATGASHLLLSGTRLYVARRDQGYDILSIATPAAPTLLGRVTEPGSYSHGALVNSRLVLSAGPAGLRAFNITNPASPQLISTFAIADALMVAGLGNTAWLPEQGALRGVSYSAPSAPSAVSSLPIIGPTQQLHANPTRIYAPQFPSGVAIYSNLDGSRGDLLGRVDLPGAYRVITTNNVNTLVVASVINDATSLVVVDTSTPATPTVLASVPLNSAVNDFFAVGSRIYAATSSGVYVFDLSNPNAPQQLALWQGQFLGALAIQVSGTRAYMGFNNAVRIANIVSVVSPSLLGEFALDDAVLDIELLAPNLYVSDVTDNLKVLNINNASAISLRSTHNFFPGIGYAMARDFESLYIAAGPLWGTYIADISSAASVTAAGNYGTPDEVVDVAVTNLALIAAENRNGIRITTCAAEAIFANGFE